jgi:dTMP kinase
LPDRAGYLIAFEGPEGAGKSTQLALAARALERDGYSVEVTSEPGGTALGRSLRQLLLHDEERAPTALAELFLMLADRAQHVSQVILPALARGALVLSDRFSGSTLAYQGYGRGLDLATVAAADAWARQGVAPRLTVLLDCPAGVGLRRAQRADRFHEEDMGFHERVRGGFLALAAAEPECWSVVDSTRPQEVVHAEIMGAILRAVGPQPRT